MVSFEELLTNTYVQTVIKAAVIVIVSFVIKTIIDFYFFIQMLNLKRIKSKDEKKVKITRIDFLRKIVSTFIIIMTAIFILLLIPGFKTFSLSLLAGAGIAAVIVGFAAQKTLANIVSGFSIAFYAPFRVGDRLKIGEDLGDVEEITLRHTVIKTWDNRRLIIPNSIISEKEIVNYSIKEERTLSTINIGISYDSDIDKAKKIMIDLAKKHKNVVFPEIANEEGVKEKKYPTVSVTDCGDFSVNLRLFFWVDAPRRAVGTGFELLEQIKKEFDKQGVEIPFPYRTIVYKKDLERKKRKR